MMGTRAGSSMMGGWDQAASGGASGHLGGSPMPLKASSGGAGKKPSIDVMTTSTAAAGLSLGSSALDGFHGSVTSAGVQAVTSSSGGTNILDGSSQHTSSTTSGSATGYPVDSRSSGQQNLTGADQNYLAHQNRILIQHAMRVEQQLAEADLVTRTRIQAQK
uniref:Uncharacterized protein n=1 Tax=Craspedostauros australis TaxID=1486917 RepID=A0A7R9ZPT0_9STRA|mmetsp:Transcript_2913/g.8021  ORF Transcript_2913/g.8021 Transcript_2913/m.8021 type:complete len:162 (+) Transcript_2913:2-487(+)